MASPAPAAKPFRLPWYKRLLKQPLVQRLLAWLMAIMLRLFWLSFKVDWQIDAQAKPYIDGEKQGIFCFWHGRMILLPFCMPKGRAMYVLISQHRDGELVARMISHFSIRSIRGSSSRNAREATNELLARLMDGENISITPDGPRGPAFQARRGALHLARQSGCALIPLSFSASRAKILKSWDAFMIPLPFSHIRFSVGAPIFVSETSTLKELQSKRAILEQELNAVNEQADEVHRR